MILRGKWNIFQGKKPYSEGRVKYFLRNLEFSKIRFSKNSERKIEFSRRKFCRELGKGNAF